MKITLNSIKNPYNTNPKINIPWKSSTTHSKTHKIGPLGADQDLEEHTVKRLTWEAEAEGRARTDEPKVGTGEGLGKALDLFNGDTTSIDIW